MNLIVWLALVLNLGVCLLWLPHPALLAVWLVFLIAPLVSWLLLLTSRKRISLKLEAPGVVQKAKAFTFRATVEKHGFMPMGKTVIHLSADNAVTGEIQKNRLKLRDSEEWTMESAYCGGITCQVTGLWCYELFGIIPVSVPCNVKKRIIVMPDTFPVTVSSVLSQAMQDDCAEYAPDQKGYDRTEILQIRDYVPGDPLQQIHWKLSSKWDRLIVRDPALPVDRELTVFLEQWDENRTPGQADTLMEAVVSVCQALAEAGQPFTLAWNEDVIQSHSLTNPDQLPELIAMLLKSRRRQNLIPGAELYQKTGHTATGAVLYFCSVLPNQEFPALRKNIYLCGQANGENVTPFTAETMFDVLGNLTWS